MSELTKNTQGNSAMAILPTQRQEYKEISKETVTELVEKAKAVSAMDSGLPSSDSIEYYAIDDLMEVGGKTRFTYLATTVESRMEEETGELSMLPIAIVIDQEGNFWKNAAFSFVRHFAGQSSGYQAEMTFKGYRKTSNGNKMQRLEFRPLA